MIWTPEIIRARFVEAADTARRHHGGHIGPGTAAGYWPNYLYSFEDMAHWGDARLAEEREMRLMRRPPSSAAISRANEVDDWIASRIEDPKKRKIVQAWAICRAVGMSFSARCKKEGWVKVTAYRRLHATIEAICFNLENGSVLLRMPDEKWLLPEQPSNATDLDNISTVDEAEPPPVLPTFIILNGDRPRDLLTSPKAIEKFARHLAKVNKQRRREQVRKSELEAKKRKILGIEETAA